MRARVATIGALFALGCGGTGLSVGGPDAGIDSGGATPDAPRVACTGAGVCGHGPTGIFCARSDGASSFTGYGQWSADFADAGGETAQSQWATIQFPDLDGDWRADVCGRVAGGIICALSTGAASFAPAHSWSDGFSDALGWDAQPSYWATIQFPDLNGDGRADVCGRGPDGIECALSGGVGFGPVSLWSAAFSDAAGWGSAQSHWGTIQFPDLDGDGKADVCGVGTGGVVCALSNGATGFGAATVWQTAFGDDGSRAGSWWGTIQFPDVNGDGRADVCGRDVWGIICALSMGGIFGPTSSWLGDFTNAADWDGNQSYWGTIQFPDVNGDGKADVCGRGPSALICALSNGNVFDYATVWTTAFTDSAGYTVDPTLWPTIQFPDLDGDGKADICARGAAGVMCGLSDGHTFAVGSWLAQFTDADGWGMGAAYGGSLQAPILDGTGCAVLPNKTTALQPLARRLPPF
jgi:hypothetical protein